MSSSGISSWPTKKRWYVVYTITQKLITDHPEIFQTFFELVLSNIVVKFFFSFWKNLLDVWIVKPEKKWNLLKKNIFGKSIKTVSQYLMLKISKRMKFNICSITSILFANIICQYLINRCIKKFQHIGRLVFELSSTPQIYCFSNLKFMFGAQYSIFLDDHVFEYYSRGFI